MFIKELMAEGLTPYDDFPGDDEFDRVEEHVAPMDRIPLRHNGVDFTLTPANAAVRMFFDEGQREYSRVVVYPGDGSTASVKMEDALLHAMVRGGFPVELPDRPDETDEEFIRNYVRIWSEETSAELGLDC
jgi:hypothetical protein